jgi:hypothetical protein
MGYKWNIGRRDRLGGRRVEQLFPTCLHSPPMDKPRMPMHAISPYRRLDLTSLLCAGNWLMRDRRGTMTKGR